MFGYVRPDKPELLIREYTRYRAVYCGLCKTIGRHYGQSVRLFLGYDLTMLALLLLSLSDKKSAVSAEGCLLNPFHKKPVLKEDPILGLCAGLTILMTWYKAEDDKQDGQFWRGQVVQLSGYRAYRKARKEFPVFDRIIRDSMTDIRKLEERSAVMGKTADDKGTAEKTEKLASDAASLFGSLLHDIFLNAAETCLAPRQAARDHKKIIEAAGLLGYDLGCWIYILDAIDDFEPDCDNNQWNPLSGCGYDEAVVIAEKLMVDYEMKIDRTAALLPYYQDSGLIANIVLQGLSHTRKAVIKGDRLKRI